jgi:hypothetical protein
MEHRKEASIMKKICTLANNTVRITWYGVTDTAGLYGDLQSFNSCLCQNSEGEGRKSPYNVSNLYYFHTALYPDSSTRE